jgi:hypothetical protein
MLRKKVSVTSHFRNVQMLEASLRSLISQRLAEAFSVWASNLSTGESLHFSESIVQDSPVRVKLHFDAESPSGDSAKAWSVYRLGF